MSSSFGNFTYHVQRAETEFDKKARRALNGEKQTEFSSAEDFWENGSIEDLQQAAKKLARADADKAAAERSQRDGDTFTKLFPEYIDSPKNARTLKAACMAAYGTEHPTLEQMATQYDAYRANGLVDINQKELAKQADTAATERAKAFRANVFDEETAYTLDLEELRRRANGTF